MSFVQINNANDSAALGFGNEYAGMTWIAGSPSFEDITVDAFGDGTQSVQTWTGSVKLSNIKVRMDRSSATTTTMQVYEGAGTDGTNLSAYTAVSTATAPDVDVTATEATINYDFSSQSISLTAGNTYFFVIRSAVLSSGILQARRSGDLYGSGNAMFISASTGDITALTALDFVFRITVENEASAAGDPLIQTIAGDSYYLPIDNNYYCLLDTMDATDRLVINCKTYIRKNTRSYMRFIYVSFNNDEFLVRLPNLTMSDPDIADLNNLIEADNVPRWVTQEHQNGDIQQIKHTNKVRKYQINTTNYGSFVIYCTKVKARVHIKGNVSNFIGTNAIGCFMGSEEVLTIPNIKYKTPLP